MPTSNKLLSGKIAIVTGGAQGLGQGIAERFAHFGAQVIILDVQAKKAQAAAESLPGTRHLAFECDITEDSSRQAAISAILENVPTVEILVNNAGIQYHTPVEEIDKEEWYKLFDINVHAMVFMCRDVGNLMLKQRSGSIINIGSIASLFALPRRLPYTTSKTAVLGITRSLAVEWADRGVRVNSISPGFHKTPLLMEYIKRGALDGERIRRRIPMGKIGSPQTIGDAAVFFASDLSSYITGQNLVVDGGYTVFGALRMPQHELHYTN